MVITYIYDVYKLKLRNQNKTTFPILFMKKILMVCEAFGGGVFAYVSQLCNDMCGEFEVYLAYAVRPQTPQNYRDVLDNRVHLIEVKNFGHLKNPIINIKLIRELRGIKRNVNPDIIHLHSSIAGGVGRLVYKTCEDYKLVYTPHGYAHILMGKFNTMRCRVFKLMELLLGKRNCITLTCCESEDDEAKKLTRRTTYVETGINLKDFQETIDPIQPEKTGMFTVYTMGRICTQKQPDLFNHIAELVPEAHFVWIGTGELQMQLTAKNLEVTGWKPRHEAIAMGKGADIYILCSLGEAIAMSLIENMYLGKLCLVSNTMGNKSVIVNGVNGYVCDKAEDYAACIRACMDSFPQDLADRGKRDVFNRYNTEVMKRNYVLFYNEAIDGKYDK